MVPNQIISSWSHRRMTMHCSKLTHRIHPLFPLYALHALTNLQPGGPSTASAWITHPQQPSNALQPACNVLRQHSFAVPAGANSLSPHLPLTSCRPLSILLLSKERPQAPAQLLQHPALQRSCLCCCRPHASDLAQHVGQQASRMHAVCHF